MRDPIAPEILATVTVEDLPEDMQLVADSIGLGATIDLMTGCAGLTLNIPKRGFIKAARRYIIRRYDGTNSKDLALACGMTERFVYSVLAAAKGPGVLPGQMNLFEPRLNNQETEAEADVQNG